MEALKLTAEQAAGAASMGVMLIEEGDFSAAALAFRCAVAVTNQKEHWAALGFCEQKMKHLEAAVGAYQRAIEGGLSDVQTWANLGEAFIDMLQYGRAIDALEKAIALDPDAKHPAGIRARALVLKGLKDLGTLQGKGA